MREKVEKLINKIRPYLQYDGGDIELVSVSDDGIVEVKLGGACVGCAYVDVTINSGVKTLLMEEIPEIKDVILLSDEL